MFAKEFPHRYVPVRSSQECWISHYLHVDCDPRPWLSRFHWRITNSAYCRDCWSVDLESVDDIRLIKISVDHEHCWDGSWCHCLRDWWRWNPLEVHRWWAINGRDRPRIRRFMQAALLNRSQLELHIIKKANKRMQATGQSPVPDP